MTLADLPQIQALPAWEKLQLLNERWLEIAHDVQTVELAPAEKELLDARWRRFLSDPSSAPSLEDFEKRLATLRA